MRGGLYGVALAGGVMWGSFVHLLRGKVVLAHNSVRSILKGVSKMKRAFTEGYSSLNSSSDSLPHSVTQRKSIVTSNPMDRARRTNC